MKRILACALAFFALTAYAQTYPSRPIKFVAPFPPGGSSDVLCRLLGAKLAEGLGQPVTVENRPGAAASIGHEYAAKQPPDGYTIVITSSSTLVNNLYLYKHHAFDAFTDFAPISMIASAGQVLVVHPSVPAKSVRELIALAKSQPGKLNFGSGGKGIQSHISGEMFKAATGVDIVHVPYKGTVQSVADLVAGQVQMVFSDMVPAMPHIRAGRLRPLAVTTRERAAVLPDVPTMIEAGVKDYVVNTWMGFATPAGVPAPVLDRLNAEINRIGQSPAVRDKMLAQGIEMLPPDSPAQAQKLVRDDLALWLPIIKASGASADQ